MEIEKNKRGLATISLILVIVVGFFLVVFLTILSYSMGAVDGSLSQLDGNIGNDSLQEVYGDTLQLGVISMETTFPQIISISVLLGMVISMVVVGYNIKNLNQIWILVDIFILIVAEALAVLIKSLFTSYMNSNEAFLGILRDTLPFAAKFILNLPILVPTIGVVIMIATYFVAKDKEEEVTDTREF